MKKKILLSALLILTCTLTACGKKDRKDIDKDLGGNTTENAAENTGISEESAQEEIPESLSYTVSGTTVEAKVSAEGYGQVPVYKLEKKEESDEWVKSYAELLFDGGEYVNVKPYEFCSKAELEEEKKVWEQCLSELTDKDDYNNIEKEIENLEFYMGKSEEGNSESYPEDKLIYETDSYNEDASEILKSHKENALIRGEVNGDIWKLEYAQSRYDGENEGGTYSNMYVPSLHATCPSKKGYFSIADGYTGINENICDKETAQRDAQEFLDRLGFSDMELIRSFELYPYTVDENGSCIYDKDYYDGYGMIFAPMLGNIKSPVNMTTIEASADGTNFITQPRVSILINSDGVFSFCIVGGYEIEETLTAHSSMLTFEQIDAIAKDEFEKAGTEQRVTITQVNFGYMYVSYEDSSYAAVPVWSYCAEESYNGETVIKPILTICALDGTVIETEQCVFDYDYFY